MADALINLDELSFIDDTDEEIEASTDRKSNRNSPEQKSINKNTDYILKYSKLHPGREEFQEQPKKLKLVTCSGNETRQLSEACNDKQRLFIDQFDQIDGDKKCMLKEVTEKQTSRTETQKKRFPVVVEVTVNGNNMEKYKNSNVVTVELHEVGLSKMDTNTANLPAKSQARYKPHISKCLPKNEETKVPKTNNDYRAEATTDTKKVSGMSAVNHSQYDHDTDKEAYAYREDFSMEDSHRTESVTTPDLSQSDTLRSLQELSMQSSEELPTQSCSNVPDSQVEHDFHRLTALLSESKCSVVESVESTKDSESAKSTERPKDIGILSRSDASNRLSRKKSKTLRIVVTNEEGVDEHVEEISQSGRNRLTSELSPDSDSSGGSYSHLRKICAQRKTSVAEEIAKNKKTKPFKRLVKLWRGCFEVGIDGDRKRCNIKAITLMKNKRLVMFDRNNKCLKLFDKDFVPLDRLSISVKFCGVASVFEHTIAVTLPEEKKLQLVHVNKNKFEKGRTLPIEAEFYSLTHYKGTVYLLKRHHKSGLTEQDDWQIVSLDLNKNNTESVKAMRTFCPGHQDNTLLANSSGLYMTHKLENEILHLGLDGSFKVRYKILMSLPMGIASDRFGNIYVCGGSVTSFIEVCKFNLKGSKIIYHKTSSDPVAICFDKQDNVLFVCDKVQGNIMKYKIEHNGMIQGLMQSFAMGVNV